MQAVVALDRFTAASQFALHRTMRSAIFRAQDEQLGRLGSRPFECAVRQPIWSDGLGHLSLSMSMNIALQPWKPLFVSEMRYTWQEELNLNSHQPKLYFRQHF